MNKTNSKIKIHCNRCGQYTWHDLIKTYTVSDTNKEHNISVGTTSKLYKCCGCETITLSHCDWHSECDDPAIYFYPPRVSRKEPKWLESPKIPLEVHGLFKEIYTALYNDCRRLAAMGIRTLFDQYIQMKVGDQSTFTAGLNAVLEKKHITQSQKNLISVAIDAGNATSHRAFNPDINILNTVFLYRHMSYK